MQGAESTNRGRQRARGARAGVEGRAGVQNRREALVVGLEQFEDVRSPNGALIQTTQTQALNRLPRTAGLVAPDLTDRVVVRHTGADFQLQRVDEGHVLDDRDHGFGVQFLGRRRTGDRTFGVETEDVARALGGVRREGQAVFTVLGAEGDRQRTCRQFHRRARDVQRDVLTLEDAEVREVQTNEGCSLGRDGARAEHVDRNAVREDQQRRRRTGGGGAAARKCGGHARTRDVVLDRGLQLGPAKGIDALDLPVAAQVVGQTGIDLGDVGVVVLDTGADLDHAAVKVQRLSLANGGRLIDTTNFALVPRVHIGQQIRRVLHEIVARRDDDAGRRSRRQLNVIAGISVEDFSEGRQAIGDVIVPHEGRVDALGRRLKQVHRRKIVPVAGRRQAEVVDEPTRHAGSTE
ncbi:hypothetical protein D3C80_822430 [compost metagenome]